MRRPESAVPPAGRDQDPNNRREQVLVHHLLDNLVERLSDRSGTTHTFPWTPAQEVRVGVLGVKYETPGPDGPSGTTATADDHDDGAGISQGTVAPPVDNRGVIGVDFIASGAVTTVDLTVDISYALYHPLIPDHATISAEAQTQAEAARKNRRRRPTVPTNPNWVRDNRHVTVQISAPVTGREESVTSQQLPGGDPLEADARSAVAAHYTNPDALWKLTINQTLPVAAALGTPAEYRQALDNRRDREWRPLWPQPCLTVTTIPTPKGEIAVSVSIANAREITDRSIQDLSAYDTHMAVTVRDPGQIVSQQLGFADDDLRYVDAATVVGRGRGCVAQREPKNTIVAETLPLHIQQDVITTNHNVDITYSNLASEYMPTLEAIAIAMESFLHSWDLNPAKTNDKLQQFTDLRNRFKAEIERFELGCKLLHNDTRLDQAFRLANRTFLDTKGPRAAWRLFQLVFVITELGALAGRENSNDPRLRMELDAVDVLWFPTGGGKTEAYLGLITVGLFFDRLRDKSRGTTAWLLFPLRMLSVQQLARTIEVIHHAEAVRNRASIGGDPFTLGYLVGSGNTPNRLAGPAWNAWWPGLAEFASWDSAERDTRRLVSGCPSCLTRDSVGLEADLIDHRLLHVCRACSYILPVHSSDEEVTRYQPSVIVSTVDKMTAFSRNGQLTSLNRGPRKRCPQHGWYTHNACVVGECRTDPGTHTDPTGFRDTTPSLWIQDELHLVREELGVFAGHYHTLIAELARGAGNEPPKVIAATATIEQFEDQLSQVYGRRPRMFPAGGPTLERSFYTEVTNDIRRLYLGVLPAGGGTVKVDVASDVTTSLIKNIHDLTDDPTHLITAFAAEGFSMTPSEVRSLLFEYELALAYVNSKAHGVVVYDDIDRLSETLLSAGSDRVRSEYLTGETPLGEIAHVVATVEDNTTTTPRADRIRALVGTSIISHGVDLDRLNLQVLAGMPPSYANYIQATGRAGRTHVGLVVSVFDRGNRRETSMYQSFATTHTALERMVEPVPVNRFAARAVERTLPGIVCSLLWDETRNPAWESLDAISMTRKFRMWWNAHAANLNSHLRSRIEGAYRCPVNHPAMAQDEAKLLADALARWDTVERQRMQQWQADWLTDLFTSPAMTSLRDVDQPVEFSGGNRAAKIVSRLHA